MNENHLRGRMSIIFPSNLIPKSNVKVILNAAKESDGITTQIHPGTLHNVTGKK